MDDATIEKLKPVIAELNKKCGGISGLLIVVARYLESIGDSANAELVDECSQQVNDTTSMGDQKPDPSTSTTDTPPNPVADATRSVGGAREAVVASKITKFLESDSVEANPAAPLVGEIASVASKLSQAITKGSVIPDWKQVGQYKKIRDYLAQVLQSLQQAAPV